ncbi:MAG: LPS assembly lipoprotein LptE [Paludibacteraceae bacterium]|nr:LPS assembly lipoprotein LptE [Paludibacteraceae bacterium]
MGWNRKHCSFAFLCATFLIMIVASCRISYKFNGSSIDYTKIKTISIQDFPNRAPLVYPTLATDFTENLRDEFSSKTSLKMVDMDGDLQISGEISGYNVISSGVDASGEASESRLQMSVRVKFVNKVNSSEDFEKTFSAYEVFSNQYTIDQVQAELNEQLMDDIINQIFNATVANW